MLFGNFSKRKKLENNLVEKLIFQQETIIAQYDTLLQNFTFTNQKIIHAKTKAFSSKIDYSVYFYHRINAIDLQTKGIVDINSELWLRYDYNKVIKINFNNDKQLFEIVELLTNQIRKQCKEKLT